MLKYEHGGDIYTREILYDFSANINPLGMPRNVKKELKKSVDKWESYPDPLCRKLRLALAEYEGFPAENIVCGNGAADLIYRIVSVVKPKNVLIAVPAFSEYEKALSENGCNIKKHCLCAENGFALDESILKKISGVDMLILCTPNNPPGVTIPRDLLMKICRKCEQENVIFLCDQCFMDFVENGKMLSAINFSNPNVIVLKAFTKIYAMAGLRLGYAVFGSSALAETVKKTGQCWSVSVPAQAAGIAALQETEYVRKTVQLIKAERDFLTEELQKFSFEVYNGEANFILFRCDYHLDKMLLNEKIAIRNCSNYESLGEGFFRIAVRSHEENLILVSAIRRCLNG